MAELAFEHEVHEEFIMMKMRAGESIVGVYPPSAEVGNKIHHCLYKIHEFYIENFTHKSLLVKWSSFLVQNPSVFSRNGRTIKKLRNGRTIILLRGVLVPCLCHRLIWSLRSGWPSVLMDTRFCELQWKCQLLSDFVLKMQR